MTRKRRKKDIFTFYSTFTVTLTHFPGTDKRRHRLTWRKWIIIHRLSDKIASQIEFLALGKFVPRWKKWDFFLWKNVFGNSITVLLNFLKARGPFLLSDNIIRLTKLTFQKRVSRIWKPLLREEFSRLQEKCSYTNEKRNGNLKGILAETLPII